MNLKNSVLIEIESYDEKSAETLRDFYASEFQKGLFHENESIQYNGNDKIGSLGKTFSDFRNNEFGLKETLTAYFDTENYEPFLDKIDGLFVENPTLFMRFTYSNLLDKNVENGDYEIYEIFYNSKDEEVEKEILYDCLTDGEVEDTFEEIYQERSYMQIFDGVERLKEFQTA